MIEHTDWTKEDLENALAIDSRLREAAAGHFIVVRRDGTVSLDGDFTASNLRKIADAMEAK